MATATQLKNHVLTRAAKDSHFRARLIDDPKAAIAWELGITLPDSFDVVVHEDSATTSHLVLAPSPKLTDADLKAAAGGIGGMVTLW